MSNWAIAYVCGAFISIFPICFLFRKDLMRVGELTNADRMGTIALGIIGSTVWPLTLVAVGVAWLAG